jgi:hypothetical protein
MHNSTTLSQPWVSDNPEFEAWWSDDKRSGSTFGYQDTKEGVWIAFKMQAFNGWLASQDIKNKNIQAAIDLLTQLKTSDELEKTIEGEVWIRKIHNVLKAFS